MYPIVDSEHVKKHGHLVNMQREFDDKFEMDEFENTFFLDVEDNRQFCCKRIKWIDSFKC